MLTDFVVPEFSRDIVDDIPCGPEHIIMCKGATGVRCFQTRDSFRWNTSPEWKQGVLGGAIAGPANTPLFEVSGAPMEASWVDYNCGYLDRIYRIGDCYLLRQAGTYCWMLVYRCGWWTPLFAIREEFTGYVVGPDPHHDIKKLIFQTSTAVM